MEENNSLDIKQFVIFKLDNEEYGIDIQKVTTIERIVAITRVPKTSDYVKGVINLRGEIVPILDLRWKFGLGEVEDNDDTRIIIIKINDISAGIIVESVSEVTQLTEEAIETAASFNSGFVQDYILGVGKLDNRIVTLLDLEKLLRI